MALQCSLVLEWAVGVHPWAVGGALLPGFLGSARPAASPLGGHQGALSGRGCGGAGLVSVELQGDCGRRRGAGRGWESRWEVQSPTP